MDLMKGLLHGVVVSPNEHRLHNLALLWCKCTSSYGWHEQIYFSAHESGRTALCEGNLCMRPIDVHLHWQETFRGSGWDVEVVLWGRLFLQAGWQDCNSSNLAKSSGKHFCGNVAYSHTKAQYFTEGFNGPEHLSEKANRWNPAVATTALAIHRLY